MIALSSLAIKGPGSPPTTLLKSLKSNVAPCSSKSSPTFANSVALILVSVPSGIVTPTMLLVVANVSSKSNTDIPFTGALGLRALRKALS